MLSVFYLNGSWLFSIMGEVGLVNTGLYLKTTRMRFLEERAEERYDIFTGDEAFIATFVLAISSSNLAF